MAKGYPIYNKRLSDDDFFRIRKEEVLSQWETGKQLENFEELIEGAREISVGTNYAERILDAEAKGLHILQPQFGQALTEFMIDGMTYVEEHSPLVPNGIWNIFSDSYTRKRKYDLAADGIERSKKSGSTELNGWPIVNFGLEEAKRIKRAVKCPISINSTDEDGRLTSEFALAAGWNGANCRSITEVVSHCRDIPLAEEIRINQYESRLAAKYNEAGVLQMPHISSNLTAYDSAGFKVFTMVTQCLLGGEQGLKQIYLENGLNMNIIQDAAMIRTSKKLCEEYSKKFGYDMKFIAGSFPYLGAWPPRLEEADAMIAWNTMVSIMAGTTPLMLKCADEAFATPTKEGMASSVRISRMIERLIGDQRTPESPEYLLEQEMLEKEVRAWVDYTLEAGDGDIAQGLCRGVDEGFIDTMVTPWIHLKKKVRIMRDTDNAVRYLDIAGLPLPKEVVEYHTEKLLSREKKEGRPCDFDMVVSDLQFASRLQETETEKAEKE
jgi:methylaspartate mutase epsilon subunit